MAFSKERAHERAERFAGKGQHEKAAREYRTIVDNDPKDLRAWLRLADCLVRCEKPQEAIVRYLRVAEFYVEQRQVNKALAVYRQVVSLDASRLDVRTKCATLELELGRTQDAIGNFEQVAQVKLKRGNLDEALELYGKVADLDPKAVSKRLRLAELYSRERRTQEAVEAFRTAANELLATGRHDDYVRVAERLLFHKDDDLESLYALARTYLRLKDPRRALVKLNALLRNNAHDRIGLELLAETFLQLSKPDKAVSVVLELVRELADGKETSRAEALRVVQKGLQWDPSNPSLQRLRQELEDGTGPEPSDSVSLELDDSDIVELDEEDVVLAESNAALAVGAPQRTSDSVSAPGFTRSLTDSVLLDMSEEPAAAPEPALTADLDKVLFEARVYIKYRLFEHAFDHVQELIDQHPNHIGALELRATALTELGRKPEAARTHARIAELVSDRDPKLAQQHVRAALQLVPDLPEAKVLADGNAAPGGSAGVPELLIADIDPDSQDLDLEDLAHHAFHNEERTVVDAGSLGRESEKDELEIDLVDLPTAEFERRPEPVREEPPLQPQSYRTRPTVEQPAVVESSVPHHSDVSAELAAEISDALSELDMDEEMPTLVHNAGDAPQAAQPVASGGAPSPATQGTSNQSWPDLTEELAEIQFFMDQGLEEDAELALKELRARHPGHPELAEPELDGRLDPPRPAPVTSKTPTDGAQPLFDLDQEDQEADAYLMAIFSGHGGRSHERRVEISADAGVEDADARTLFDLGTAYREMGLHDDALLQFKQASRDPGWRSRAFVMIAGLHSERGDIEQAAIALREALVAARTEDERSEAHYELGVLYEKAGDIEAAIASLREVAAGFRDRDERLEQLTT